MFAGDLSVANQVIHGSANMMLVGDSIMDDIAPAYATQWHPDRWSGVVVGPDYSFGQFTLSNPSVSSTIVRNPLSTVGPAGLTTTAPGAQAETVFNGVAAPSVDATPTTLADRFYEVGLDTALGAAGGFATGTTGSVTVTPLVYANANGVADGSVSMSLRTDAYTSVGTLPLNGNIAATPTLVSSSITVPKQTYTVSGSYLTADFRVSAGAAPANGSNFTVAGVRFSDGGPGLQLANIANGGWTAEKFLDNSTTPLANVQQFVSLTDTNVTLIALGTNELGPDSAATFKSLLQQLIDRYRSANANMKFILMTTYDVNQTYATEADGTLRQVAFNQDMYQLSQENSGVLFLNLFDKAPDWATLKANYLSDDVHPTATVGADYFAGLEWDLMNEAAVASTPEPASATILLVGAGVMMGRRRRAQISVR